MSEISMPGGAVSGVVRVGNTVRRRPGPYSESKFVHRLLSVFERTGWGGAPRFLGTDVQGREVLTFVAGHVAWERVQPSEVTSDESLARVAAMVREFHDLTAGTDLAGGEEVVCHNDLSPRNTVYRDLGSGLRPVAFIDWDAAAPGRRIHDVAHVCWQYLRLGPDGTEVQEAARGIRLICDAYGMTPCDRSNIVEAILWWQDRCWRGIDSRAASGDPAMIGLRDGGAAREVQAAHAWVAEHRRDLELRSL